MNEESILNRKLESLYTDRVIRKDAASILNKYGAESHEREMLRVKLAIVKLASNDLDKLIKFTDAAKQDFRDVLSWAEYLRQSKNWSLKDNKKKQKLINEDLDEYQKWLNT